MQAFLEQLSPAEYALLESLDTPLAIQAFLDACPYRAEYSNLSPRQVLAERRAHCLDGAIFAAAALRRLGFPPLLVDLFPEPGTDDDHVLAIFHQHGCLGAVAKSNFSGLRYREPVYRSLRELVMSYFDWFFNVDGQRTLRTYTRPLSLASLDAFDWMGSQAGTDLVEKRLLGLKPIDLLTPELAASLTRVDRFTYRAGTLGTDPEGLFKPKGA